VTTVAGAEAGPLPPDDSSYWTFYEQVAAAQLAAWLPPDRQLVLDLSGGTPRRAEQLVQAGHDVVHVRGDVAAMPSTTSGPGRLLPVVGDPTALSWLDDASVDAVLAESGSLSSCLATEVTLADLRRVLRPGGRLLLVVESLVLGLARLADLGRWAELADVPSADVVLVPQEDGSITRCFWPEQLQELLVAAGLDVDWVRPRSVLSPATVTRALHLVASARRPG
jgi:SAM-dependent methyltransferase